MVTATLSTNARELSGSFSPASRLLMGFALLLFAGCIWSIALIELASIAVLVLGAVELWRRGASNLPRGPVLATAAFAVALLVTSLFGVEPLASAREMRGLYKLALPFLLLPALLQLDRRVLVGLLAGGVILSGLYGALQFNTGVDWVRPMGEKLVTPSIHTPGAFHAKGSFSHHLTYANVMLIHLPFFSALLLFDRSRWRWLWGAAALSAGLGVALSMGRSGWIGAGAGMAVLMLLLPRKLFLGLLVSGGAAVILFVSGMTSGLLQQHFDQPDSPVLVKRLLGTSFQNDRDRLYMWEAAWLGIQANPVLGVGIGNDRSDYEHWRTVVADRYGGHRYLNPPEVGVHNVYLQVAYELGAFGLITYLAFLGSWVLWCVQHLRGQARRPGVSRGILWGVLAALVGSMTAGIFENNFFDAEVQTLLMLLFALALHAGLVDDDPAAPAAAN